ncbi:uncharacterized protein LOC111025482 [Momordica charantia]|uniref:Uncharacterized protein LOC111025482 n=1 Tax=Momordica charantia TaxID=3673 RepID=A0A6J1DYR1_MOMCH|nr:uncharacterized protein LOC111025482 [Momordica charantia]
MDKELSAMFINTLKHPFYDRMIGNASTNFSDIMTIEERIEYGVKHGLITNTAEESLAAKRQVILRRRKATLELEPLGFLLSVSTPSGSVLIASQKVRAGELSFDNQTLRARLIQLDMQDFDLILGMDWLATNQANINCSRREVSFQLLSGRNFTFKRVTGRVPRTVSALKAKRLLQNGAWGYLANVVDISKTPPSIDSVHVVREFPDVFPNDLPGLPPVRELDFCIDIPPGTAPISKAPYRMAPAELKELKA